MKNLDYFQDSDGNYILRRICTQETGEDYFLYNGTYSSNYIFKKDSLEENVTRIFEKLCDEIEDTVLKQYKIKKESILFEKIIGNFVDETKYNPLFKMLTEKECLELQGDGIKVKINLAFEFNIRIEKHLKPKAFKEFILGRMETKN